MTVSVVSWALAAIAALLLACGADVFLAAPTMGPDAWVVLVCLVIATGGLHGFVSGSLIKLLAKLGRRAQTVVTFFVIAAVSFHVAARLGVFVRLSGSYASLALSALAAAVVAILAATALVLAFVPTELHPRGPVFACRRWAWLPLLSLAAALFYADRNYWIGLYPLFHLSMRVAALSTGTFGMLLLLPVFQPSRRALTVSLAPPLGLVGAIVLGAFQPTVLFSLELASWPLLALSTARALTDVDVDGYSGVLGGGDCAPFATHVNPGAREVPDNGIDDNCLLGDATASQAQQAQIDDNAPPATQDIVLITVDSLRADHMGVYNDAYNAKGLATTPNIDAWARHETFVFERAYSAGALTSIALPSMMRGMYPRRLKWSKSYETSHFRLLHDVEEHASLAASETIAKMFPVARRDPHPPLAVRLRQRGMQTLAVVDDGFCEQLNPGSGLANGFDEYREVDDLSASAPGDAGTTDLALRMLERVEASRAFFLWVHYFGVHGPDSRHPDVRIDGDAVVHRYDHEVRYFDLHVTRLLDALAARPRPPIVVLTADHGEDVSGDTRHHGFSVNDVALHIPLLVRIPKVVGRRIQTPVSLVDVTPSALEWTHTHVPAELDGRSLRGVIEQGVRNPSYMFADAWQYDRESRLLSSYTTAFDGRNKVTFDRMLSSWTSERQSERPQPKRVSPQSKDALVSALVEYLESTGSELTLSD